MIPQRVAQMTRCDLPQRIVTLHRVRQRSCYRTRARSRSAIHRRVVCSKRRRKRHGRASLGRASSRHGSLAHADRRHGEHEHDRRDQSRGGPLKCCQSRQPRRWSPTERTHHFGNGRDDEQCPADPHPGCQNNPEQLSVVAASQAHPHVVRCRDVVRDRADRDQQCRHADYHCC